MKKQKNLTLIALLLLVWFIAYPSSAQYSNLKFESLSPANGLSSSSCNDVFEDRDGFLWFGTIDGLNKFDGYEFTVYRVILDDDNSISSNRINSITEDSSGRLWIGTANGLNYFDKGTAKFKRFLSGSTKGNGISNNYIHHLLFDNDNNQLWIATSDGINRLDLSTGDFNKSGEPEFYKYRNILNDPYSLDNNQVTSIFKDKEGYIWAVTSGKDLNRYDKEKDQFVRVPLTISNPYQLDHIPNIVMVDKNGDFWLGNNLQRLTFWDRKSNRFSLKSFTDKTVPIFDLFEDKNGVIWVATDGHGIYFIDGQKGIIEHVVHKPSDPFSLPNNQPSKIMADRKNIIWIGNYNTGVSKLVLSKSVFGHYYRQEGSTNTLSHKIAQSIFQDKKSRIWIGTDGGGLNLFDEQTKTFTHYKNSPHDKTSLSSNKIIYIAEGNSGCLWVCTWEGGLNKFDPQNGKFKRYLHNEKNPNSIAQNSVWCALEDQSGRLWLGTQAAGLNLLDPSEDKFYTYKFDPLDPKSLSNNFVLSLFVDSKNRLFVGTASGLSVSDLDDLKEKYPEKIEFNNLQDRLLQGFRVNYIVEDKNNKIWIGTDLGLIKLNNDLTINKSYTTKNGLPNNLVVGIAEDKTGNLWITSKSGLTKMNPLNESIKNFNIQDGLQGMEFQSKSIDVTEDGRILIGGINGFNIFDPAQVHSTSEKLDVFLTDFKIYNRSIKAQDTVNGRVLLQKPLSELDEVILKYNEDYLSFDFLALDFSNPGKNQYAYKLEGLDHDWHFVGNKRSASYSNLSPGTYSFKVMASNNGTWDTRPLSLTITVLSPPWKTWWAYVAYTAFLGLVLWIIVKVYTKRIRDEKEHELDQMKFSFFMNVSHEFRTPLTLILNPIDRILSSLGNQEDVKLSALTIQRSARRLLSLVNQLLDFRRTDLGKAPLETVFADMVTFSKDLFLLFKDLAEMKNLDLVFEAEEKSIMMWFDLDKVEKILTNLISNAIKFTNPGGKIIIRISRTSSTESKPFWQKIRRNQNKDYLLIKVVDSGIGLKKDQLQHVFERFFHVDNTKTGTGIGLHFVKTLVELHEGKIHVESEYEKGSIFSVYLPLNVTKKNIGAKQKTASKLSESSFDLNAIKSLEYAVATNDQQDQEDQELVQTNNGTKKPVLLIVEDNKELRMHLKNELKSTFKVREAVNGKEGLEKVGTFYPDIVISDIMMPEMDGFELCRRIKTNLETCHIPVILLSARSLEEDKIEGYVTGADEYVPKPFNIYVLKARLNNLLEIRQQLKSKFMTGNVVEPKEITTNNLDEVFLNKVTTIILDNITKEDYSLDELLKEVGISRSHFFRKIKSLTGQNPSNFIRLVKLKYAASLLSRQEHTIKEISYMSGFNSTAYFSKTFKEHFGMTPQQYVVPNI